MFLEIILGNIRGMAEGILGEINIVSGKWSYGLSLRTLKCILGAYFTKKLYFFKFITKFHRSETADFA